MDFSIWMYWFGTFQKRFLTITVFDLGFGDDASFW